jgi:hypothetical protein
VAYSTIELRSTSQRRPITASRSRTVSWMIVSAIFGRGVSMRRAPVIDVVMTGLVPAIHVFAAREKQDVDARHKAGLDDG